MICEVCDCEKIIPLWQEAFGDSEEDIIFFLKKCVNKKCIGYYEDNTLVSMLFLVDCILNDERCKYVYAACTSSKSQGNGFMTNLLNYCKKNYKKVCLIPANESLIDYYKAREFTKEADIKNLTFIESDEIKEYLFDGCSLEKPIVLFYKGE
ncbi:MAG: GNAT family N-acetyltransferase [Clostridiales bacterium]|nr:GNAT family N-acetyltransferase [Clostridiales bacterium]